jgi:hypothetical protein
VVSLVALAFQTADPPVRELGLSTFSVFDIDARTEPFRDVPVLITKGHFSMQKRTISSVSAPNTRFDFERFAASQSSVPFLN